MLCELAALLHERLLFLYCKRTTTGKQQNNNTQLIRFSD
jgi:hypothetical protein